MSAEELPELSPPRLIPKPLPSQPILTIAHELGLAATAEGVEQEPSPNEHDHPFDFIITEQSDDTSSIKSSQEPTIKIMLPSKDPRALCDPLLDESQEPRDLEVHIFNGNHVELGVHPDTGKQMKAVFDLKEGEELNEYTHSRLEQFVRAYLAISHSPDKELATDRAKAVQGTLNQAALRLKGGGVGINIEELEPKKETVFVADAEQVEPELQQ